MIYYYNIIAYAADYRRCVLPMIGRGGGGGYDSVGRRLSKYFHNASTISIYNIIIFITLGGPYTSRRRYLFIIIIIICITCACLNIGIYTTHNIIYARHCVPLRFPRAARGTRDCYAAQPRRRPTTTPMGKSAPPPCTYYTIIII